MEIENIQVGVFADGPVEGLGFATPTQAGRTGRGGTFQYLPGEIVQFWLGSVFLGTAQAAPLITSLDFYGAESGRDGLFGRTSAYATNVARFLQSFGTGLDLTDGVLITDEIWNSTSRIRPGAIAFDVGEKEFDAQDAVRDLLSVTGHTLRPAGVARNHLHRSAAGIKRLTDVRVPTRDGSYVLADIFLPAAPGRYPVIVRTSVYGRGFPLGSLLTDEDRLESETKQDEWQESGPPDVPHGFPASLTHYTENYGSANAIDWVPRGYVLVRADSRGVGRSPGDIAPFSMNEARDYYDTIEWAAAQPWSNGNVGTLGQSYLGTNQWNVGMLAPPSLKAMIPWASDVDVYRELAYPGGIFNEEYRRNWWAWVSSNAPHRPEVDFLDHLAAHRFDGPAYGPGSEGPASPDLSSITVPFLAAVSQTLNIHGRGGIEAFKQAKGPAHLLFLAGNYIPFFHEYCLDEQYRFFDRYLKGEDTAPPTPPVRLLMRTGNGAYSWRDESDWPVPGTEYLSYYLDARPAGTSPAVAGSDRVYSLTDSPGTGSGRIDYSADVPDQSLESRLASGVRFVTEPLTSDIHVGGHFKADLWVSSTTHDMDLFVSVRVVDEVGQEVQYAVKDNASEMAMTWGLLKVSHRRTDPARSQDRPWHTHLESDLLPLRSEDDIVQVEVELLPATAVIRAGQRLVLDIAPVEGRGGQHNPDFSYARREYDHSYHDAAENSLHLGQVRASRLVLPVIPPK
ncbi:CocE/NonD family hydrolase [Streptomyces sp. NPDC026672]|uniref:CocE/NonD family hydrolase n=1 Tax=unclassified Streptomyces TaxID=2593676 RepID=UPI00340BE31C